MLEVALSGLADQKQDSSPIIVTLLTVYRYTVRGKVVDPFASYPFVVNITRGRTPIYFHAYLLQSQQVKCLLEQRNVLQATLSPNPGYKEGFHGFN